MLSLTRWWIGQRTSVWNKQWELLYAHVLPSKLKLLRRLLFLTNPFRLLIPAGRQIIHLFQEILGIAHRYSRCKMGRRSREPHFVEILGGEASGEC